MQKPAVRITWTLGTVFLEDNQACILWSKNLIHHAHQKHINICHHVIRDWVADRTMVVKYLQSSGQLAGTLTKPLACDLHARLTRLLLGHDVQEVNAIVVKNMHYSGASTTCIMRCVFDVACTLPLVLRGAGQKRLRDTRDVQTGMANSPFFLVVT